MSTSKTICLRELHALIADVMSKDTQPALLPMINYLPVMQCALVEEPATGLALEIATAHGHRYFIVEAAHDEPTDPDIKLLAGDGQAHEFWFQFANPALTLSAVKDTLIAATA